MSTGVSTPELFRPLLRSLGNGGAAGGEAEAWRLCHPGTGQGGAEEGGQEVSLGCCSPAPLGASRSEPCLCPSFLHPLEAPARNPQTPRGQPWSRKTSGSSGLGSTEREGEGCGDGSRGCGVSRCSPSLPWPRKPSNLKEVQLLHVVCIPTMASPSQLYRCIVCLLQLN